MARLEDKVALIAGAGAGVGRAPALLFAQEGAAVVVADVNVEADFDVVAEIAGRGGRALYVTKVVADPDAVEGTVAQCITAFGGLNIVDNNADGATADEGKVSGMPLAKFWRTIGGALHGSFLTCRFAIPHPIERGSEEILTTSSIGATKTTHGTDAYMVAKNGFLTKAPVQKLAEHKFCVKAVAPGVVTSERVRTIVGYVAANPLAETTPLGCGEPIEMASASLFLASDEAPVITGVVLPMDGGAAAV